MQSPNNQENICQGLTCGIDNNDFSQITSSKCYPTGRCGDTGKVTICKTLDNNTLQTLALQVLSWSKHSKGCNPSTRPMHAPALLCSAHHPSRLKIKKEGANGNTMVNTKYIYFFLSSADIFILEKLPASQS